MAQIPMNGSAPQAEAPPIVGNLASWAGAVVSLGLIIGAGVWGYKLLVRDVTGVPVVRAIEGPMREQPIDPGGQQAAHQGLSVNSVAAEGTAAAPSDRLVLAPPPIKLTDLDAPASGHEVSASASAANTETPQSVVASTPQAIVAPPPIDADNVEAVVNSIVASATPSQEPLTKPVLAQEGLAVSLRPKLRPTVRKAPAPVQVASAASVDVAPETLPAGTRLVQLGAFASDEIARAEWEKLQAKFGDYLGEKKRVIQKASSGGRTFYRLRAMGFADLNDARRMCSALKAENADCIPVVTR